MEELESSEWCQLALDKVVIQSDREEQLVFVRQVGGEIVFPIAVGLYEAVAVRNALENPVSSRPLTHELVFAVVKALGGRVRCALIETLLGGIFYAKLVLEDAGGARIEIDCRPSDAICVARDAGVPLFAPRGLLAAVSTGMA
jgi:uncharacterized protein